MTHTEVMSISQGHLPVEADLKHIHDNGNEVTPAVTADKLVLRPEIALGVAEARLKLVESTWEDVAEDNPLYASAIEQWLAEEAASIANETVKVDDIRVAEAEILDRIIAECADDGEEAALIKLADVLRAKKMTELEISELQAALAAA